MTTEFEKALAATNDDFLSVFGEEVFIKGIKYNAIYEEEEVEFETGFSLVKTLLFRKTDSEYFIVGDKVVYNSVLFEIARITQDYKNESMILVEIKRA
jgi:hypothetical protein